MNDFSINSFNEILLRSKNFKEFFENVGVFFDKWAAGTQQIIEDSKSLAKQNSSLFIKSQESTKQIAELKKLLEERIVFKPIEKQLAKEKGIIQLLDEDIPDGMRDYTAQELSSFFLFKTRNASYYFCKDAFKIKKINSGCYVADGMSVRDYFVKYNPNLEVFYRVADIKEDGSYNALALKKGYTDMLVKGECIRYKKLVRYVYLTHSALLRLGLKLEEDTPSYERFLKYTEKTSVEKQDQSPKNETKINPETEKVYTIAEFAEKFFLDKKSIKKHLKALLGLSPTSCFPAGFTVPKDFVKDFIRLTNPQREPFYPIDAFSNNINLKQLESFCYAIGRYFVLNQRKFFYVLQSDVRTYHLSFITGTYHKKVWEEIEKK